MRDRDFGSWLVKQGLLQREGLRRAMEIFDSTHSRLDTVLLDMGLLSESSLLDALGRFHTTRTVSKAELSTVGPTVAQILSPRIAARLRVVPFRLEGKTLSVATLDPGDLLVEDELCVISGYLIATYVTLELRVLEALSRLYGLRLPAPYQSLISRLEADPIRLASGDAARSRPRPTRSTETESIDPDQHVPHAMRRRPDLLLDPLDLSAEDLSAFPSLRGREETDDQTVVAPPVAPAFEPPSAELGPEERLAATSLSLQNAEMREDIADAVLGHCAPLFHRRLMLVVRNDSILGWRGEGTGVDTEGVRAISIPVTGPSVFLGLLQGSDFWLGPLPQMAHHKDLVEGLGGEPPSECFILPIRLRGKTVCFLYFDNVNEGVSGLPMAELRRLAAKVSLAFQVYLMKSKIRNV